MSTALAAVSHLHRGLHQLAQKHSKAVVPATTKARAVALFAFAPSIKGNLSGRFRQWRGASVIAQNVMRIQREWLQSQLAQVGGASPDVSSDVLPSGVSPIVRVFTWQWDETSQRIRALLEKVMTNEKKSHQKVGVQVMMQHGVCRQFSFEGNECTLVSADEWFARGLQLAEQSAEFILEGLSRGMPFSLTIFPKSERCSGALLAWSYRFAATAPLQISELWHGFGSSWRPQLLAISFCHTWSHVLCTVASW